VVEERRVGVSPSPSSAKRTLTSRGECGKESPEPPRKRRRTRKKQIVLAEIGYSELAGAAPALQSRPPLYPLPGATQGSFHPLPGASVPFGPAPLQFTGPLGYPWQSDIQCSPAAAYPTPSPSPPEQQYIFAQVNVPKDFVANPNNHARWSIDTHGRRQYLNKPQKNRANNGAL
jgi:hypothetical protein